VNKAFGNPETPLVSPENFASSAEILVESRLRAARIEGFRAEHACHENHPHIPIEVAIDRWENDKPTPPRKIW